MSLRFTQNLVGELCSNKSFTLFSEIWLPTKYVFGNYVTISRWAAAGIKNCRGVKINAQLFWYTILWLYMFIQSWNETGKALGIWILWPLKCLWRIKSHAWVVQLLPSKNFILNLMFDFLQILEKTV